MWLWITYAWKYVILYAVYLLHCMWYAGEPCNVVFIQQNFDSLSERLRRDYVKRTSQNISRASASDNHEVHVPFSPVSTPCGLFVIDRNGDFDIDVCCNAQKDNLEPSIPVADAECPLPTTGPFKTSCASVADRNLDSDSSEHAQKASLLCCNAHRISDVESYIFFV